VHDPVKIRLPSNPFERGLYRAEELLTQTRTPTLIPGVRSGYVLLGFGS
jgi:hypothetical protein